jgi:hypothetical protein
MSDTGARSISREILFGVVNVLVPDGPGQVIRLCNQPVCTTQLAAGDRDGLTGALHRFTLHPGDCVGRVCLSGRGGAVRWCSRCWWPSAFRQRREFMRGPPETTGHPAYRNLSDGHWEIQRESRRT